MMSSKLILVLQGAPSGSWHWFVAGEHGFFRAMSPKTFGLLFDRF